MWALFELPKSWFRDEVRSRYFLVGFKPLFVLSGFPKQDAPDNFVAEPIFGISYPQKNK